MKKLLSDQYFTAEAAVLNETLADTSQYDIINAGENALFKVYNGEGNLDELCFTKFVQKAATSIKPVEPQTLHPTSKAAQYHSMRVYCQVQECKEEMIDPEQWGWMLKGAKLVPMNM